MGPCSSNVWISLNSHLSLLFRLNTATAFSCPLSECSKPCPAAHFLWLQRGSSSGRHRTRSGPNHKPDMLFFSFPTFLCVCGVSSSLCFATATEMFLFACYLTTQSVSHWRYLLPTEQTARDRKQRFLNSPQCCVSPPLQCRLGQISKFSLMSKREPCWLENRLCSSQAGESPPPKLASVLT